MLIMYFIVNDNYVMRFFNLIQDKMVMVHHIVEQKHLINDILKSYTYSTFC